MTSAPAPALIVVMGLLFLLVSASPAVAQAGCAVRVTAPWRSGGKVYQVIASSSGARCDTSNVALSILTPSGTSALTFASATADLSPVFCEATTPLAMRAALINWIAQPRARTTHHLPEWTRTRTEPGEENAPLRIEPEFGRAGYARLRNRGQPIYCFVQGYMGRACYVLDAARDKLTLVGVQTPPR